MRALALISLALVGCRPPEPQQPPSPASATKPPPITAPASPPACVPPVSPAGPTVEGPAYVLVDHVGVLRISDGDVRTALAMPGDSEAGSIVMVADPQGELWLSDWQGVRVLAPDGSVRRISTTQGGPRHEHLAVRSPTDVWAATSQSEWDIVHHDGARWTTVRRRAQFPGKYDDNKLIDLAVIRDAVWVSTWNGLWRGVGDDWQEIQLPEPAGPFGALWVHRDRLIIAAPNGHYMREGDQWRALGWPAQASTVRAVSDFGLVAAPNLDEPTVTIGAVEGGGCQVKSDAVRGSHIDELVVDESGRTWVITDHALAVLGRSGPLLAQWTPGSLPGLTGRLLGLAVIGRGPERLPAAHVAPTWELAGRLQTYRGRKPLAGAAIELCSSPGRDDACPGPPFTPFAAKATTAADGSFRFTGVPEGDLWLLVRPPAGLADCATPFTIVGHKVEVARDCRVAADGRRSCDLGPVTQCLPFEMPPPR